VTPLRGTCSGAINGVMTPDEALTLYRPIRTGIQRVLKTAVRVCSDADVKRAAKQLGGWSRERIEVPSETAVDMVSDLALFEPNQRGTRAYDRFLGDHADTLEPGDVDLAHQMAGARFSILRVLGSHDLAGVWVEDVINGGEPIWVLDEGLEVSAPDGVEFAMRIFDAGDFYAGFGIVVPADPEVTDFCGQAVSRGNRLPVRHSLAAALYADAIWDEWMRLEEEHASRPRRAAPVMSCDEPSPVHGPSGAALRRRRSYI
jgi:hypothetical protein